MSNSVSEPVSGIIKVPLAIFWLEPNAEYQNISSKAAANPSAWAEGLTEDQRLWLVGKVETMAIFGERVAIIDRQGEWLRVAAICQPTLKSGQGYPGWVLAGQVAENPAYFTGLELPEAVITKPTATLYLDAALTQAGGLLGYQTRLPILSTTESIFKVGLPDGNSGYLSRSEAKKAVELFWDGKNLVQEARRFLTLKYLWGGTSNTGFDCSGFVFRLYQSQGVAIPRDASEQAQAGIVVAKDNLQPGDLLFFANDRDSAKIHHVGMYIGNGLMIHSPNSRSAIRIEPFENGVYGEEYWGARRYRR